MTFFNFDLSHWEQTKGNGVGLVVLTVNTPQSKEDVEEFLTRWEEIYTKCMEDECKYALLFDTRNTGLFDLSYLVLMGKWLGRMKVLTERWMDRTAIVVANPMIKTFIGMVFKMYKPVRPFKVFEKEELPKALKWALSTQPGDSPDTCKINEEE